MFDPSKLNLDLNEENKENKEETTKEKEQIQEKSKLDIVQENKETTENNEENATKDQEILKNNQDIDILSDVEIKQDENNEEKIEIVEKDKSKEKNKNVVNAGLHSQSDENENKNKSEHYENEQEKNTEKDTETKKENTETEQEDKIIYDININSLQDILIILIEKKYDFLTIEPEDNYVKIGFRKDKIEKEIKYIRYPIYSKILIKAKANTLLNIEETNKTQEGVWKTTVKNKKYKLIIKTVPSDLWERVFLKLEETKEKVKKEVKKVSLWQILGFLWTLALIVLIVGWSFMTYIVLNAKTIEDVQFFYSLWINSNDINTYITRIVYTIFSILLFIETSFLIWVLFKFLTTKKEFKQKRIKYWIFSVLFLIICLASLSLWMYIDKKVKNLPNWEILSQWDVRIYDNKKLKSDYFDDINSLIKDTNNLIWPLEIKFDLETFATNEENNWYKIEKFIWDFWDWEIIETPNSSIIKEFDTKWIHEISLTVQEIDLNWKVITNIIEDIPSINISYLVIQEENITENWWIFVELDATDLKELWKIEWFYSENIEKPVFTWYKYSWSKAIFKETLILMNIIEENDQTNFDKVFIISWEEASDIKWKINYDWSLENELEYELSVTDIEVETWNWYIEEYKWIIDWKEKSKIWSIENPEESSKIIYEFKEYWDNTVKVILTDSAWNQEEISVEINIPKQLTLSKNLDIYNNWELMEDDDIIFEKSLNEYFINELWVPTTLKLDARYVRSSNLLYTLENISWDTNSDWDIDDINKVISYDVNTQWNQVITVNYTFKHRRIEDDIITVTQKIYIEAIKKEAIIDFQINNENNYVPITVWFDASKSTVKDENIVKFIWDYWDGTSEERDAIVPWHKYTNAWDYTINLTIVTESGKEYTASKSLILKPKPQSVSIKTSMKKTTINQWIDFSSSDSEWQIVSCLWDFWDWETSTEYNPTHAYKKAWKYTVTLQVDFSNNNVLIDSIDIEIVK